MLLPSMAMDDKYRFASVMTFEAVFVTPLCVKLAVSVTVWSASVVFLFVTLPFPSTAAYCVEESFQTTAVTAVGSPALHNAEHV